MGDGALTSRRAASGYRRRRARDVFSDDAYRQVKGRLDLAVRDLGPTQLKNISEPIRVYSLQVGLPANGEARDGGETTRKAPRNSKSVSGPCGARRRDHRGYSS